MRRIITVFLFALATLAINAQKNNSILGMWQLKNVEVDGESVDGRGAVWVFNEGGELKAGRSTAQTFNVGTWQYNQNKKVLTMVSKRDKDFNGEAQVLELTPSKLSYKKDGAVLNFVKPEAIKKVAVPTLSFKEEDFYSGEDYKYHDSEKLPWTLNAVYSSMKNTTEYVYQIDQYSPTQQIKTDSYKNSYKVKFLEDTILSIREYSYFQKDFIDMSDNEYPMDAETKIKKVFYPRKEPNTYRFIGSENVETPAGSFDCTVVEGMEDFDTKIKYWMIKNKPGIYAKILIIGFVRTNVYNLIEIKEK